jgi:hypothetical protein
MRPRFSIASLLAVIGALAVTLAAFRSPSYLWANVLFSAAFAVLVLAVLNAVYSRGERRAFWVGFAACGGAFFAACWMPGIRAQMCPRLVTEVAFDMLYPLVAPAPPEGPGQMMVAMMGGGPPGAMPVSQPPVPPPTRWTVWSSPDRTYGVGHQIGTVTLASSTAFRQIGRSLTTILVAILGGLYTRRRFRRRAAEVAPTPAAG